MFELQYAKYRHGNTNGRFAAGASLIPSPTIAAGICSVRDVTL
jgi:hypothetical protein